ncbi:MAG: 3-oxoacyl-ACP reductase [Betaproteobacteria bacterium HGW-Betaproteobacteria-5]|jgi:3-oxoacyl-[acyl-carrier protein] reductase|nr:MAG: 3-oxoacyl-ACP reductase [Betaproteobacteria bacterium HGW-Betaproteobacteria-5]PKO41154.1 MAG: 3-oxoacyl-ACP reductase [Betaproteobacteria bacterium HGW-Betaproteobacteria-6]
MINPMSLEGTTVIVTGAAQGIGLAVTTLARQLGASVVMIDLNPETLNAAAAQFNTDQVLPIAGNVTDPAFVESAFAKASQQFGAIHGLVNNAGIIRPAMIEKMEPKQWQDVIDVNLTGTFYCLQAFGRQVIAQRAAGNTAPASIVNISSIAGRKGTIGQINYSAAKSGLFGVTMSAALEWAKHDIRANAVCFGLVETPMTEVVRGEKFRDMMLARIPMGRWTTPEEVSKSICFLLSDAGSYITGQTLSVDGGTFMSS